MGVNTFSFRDTASFGKRMEYNIIGNMLMEGLDVYIPLVDDHGVDCIIKKENGEFFEVQIKARSKKVKFGSAALFGVDRHAETKNFYFVFYSERMDKMWIMSSEEFNKECAMNKTGKHIGKKNIWLNGKDTKNKTEHCKKQFEKYLSNDFSRFH